MSTIGDSMLGLCALMASLGSIAAEFSDNHVYNSGWPAAARRTCACFGLLNLALGLVSLALVVVGAPRLAATVLLLMDLGLLGAALVPGVDIRAEGERVISGLPMSYWMTFVHLAIVGSGLVLCEMGS